MKDPTFGHVQKRYSSAELLPDLIDIWSAMR